MKNLNNLSRTELQSLAKINGVKANQKTEVIIAQLEAISSLQAPIALDESKYEAMFLTEINEPITTVEPIPQPTKATQAEEKSLWHYDGEERLQLLAESEAYLKSQVWENGVPIPHEEWESKRIMQWMDEVIPLYAGKNALDKSKPFTMLVWFKAEKVWAKVQNKKTGEIRYQARELKTPTIAASMNRKRTAFYKSVHASAPMWVKDTLRNQEKVESDTVVDTFFHWALIDKEKWENPNYPERTKKQVANHDVLRLELSQGNKKLITYQWEEKPKQVHEKTLRSNVKRSDLKLRGVVQTIGKDRLVWHPTLDKHETLLTRFRFNSDVNHRTESLSSNSLQVWLDYKEGAKSVTNDGWIPLYQLGTVEVIPHYEKHAYIPELSRYQVLADVASKKIGLDDSALSHYLNGNPKVNKFYPGIKFTCHNGIISRTGSGLIAVATRQLVKVQNKVVVNPSKDCYRKGQPFPAMLDSLKDAERWLQNNYNALIDSEVKVTTNNRLNREAKSDVRFISKQLLRESWLVGSGDKLDEKTSLAIASRLVASITPQVAKETAKRLSLTNVKEVSDLFSPKRLGLWVAKDNTPSSGWYELIQNLVKVTAEIELSR